MGGVFTEDQADRGQALYKEHCQSCHGPSLRGTPGGAAILGSAWKNKWVSLTLGEFYGFIQAAMPAGKPGSLSEQEYADIVAFALSKGKYPAGDAELPSDLEALSGIAIVEVKGGHP
jgi:mono/diheme cytochrome c family protein